MFTPRFVVSKAEGVGGDPIPEDEPVLVIRAQDVLAMHIMDEYISLYETLPHASEEVRKRLYDHRGALYVWQRENLHKIKVAD